MKITILLCFLITFLCKVTIELSVISWNVRGILPSAMCVDIVSYPNLLYLYIKLLFKNKPYKFAISPEKNDQNYLPDASDLENDYLPSPWEIDLVSGNQKLALSFITILQLYSIVPYHLSSIIFGQILTLYVISILSIPI